MKVVKLGELIHPSGPKAKYNSGLPVYSVTKHTGFVPSSEYFKKQVFSRDVSGYRIVRPGEFAYSTIHLDEGAIGISPTDALISPMYTVFRTNKTLTHSGYLLRFLKSPRALSEYSRLGTGAVHRRKSISLDSLATLEVPLPPLAEQRRIAAILDQADTIRAKRRQVIERLEGLTQSVFLSVVRSADTQSTPAGVALPEMRNGVSPSLGGSVRERVLTLSAVTGGAFNEEAIKDGTFASPPARDKRVTHGDILICRGNGNLSFVGAGVLAPEGCDAVFPDTVIAATIDRSVANPQFLEVAWRQVSVRKQIQKLARTTNGTYKVNQQLLSTVTLPLPAIPVQEQFAIRGAQVTRHRSILVRALARDDALFASLQSRAFRGEL